MQSVVQCCVILINYLFQRDILIYLLFVPLSACLVNGETVDLGIRSPEFQCPNWVNGFMKLRQILGEGLIDCLQFITPPPVNTLGRTSLWAESISLPLNFGFGHVIYLGQ